MSQAEKPQEQEGLGNAETSLTSDELAARYKGKPTAATLHDWRNGRGKRRAGGRITYRMSDIRAWEEGQRDKPPAS